MKTTITKSEFTAAFHNMGRGNQFTYKGLCELYDYLINMEDVIGEELELDVIALCCDFTESDVDTIASDFGIDLTDCKDFDNRFDKVLDYIESETAVVYSDEDTGMIMYENF